MQANLKVLWASAALQMRQSFGRSMFRFCMIFYPILWGFIMFMMYKEQDNSAFVSFVMLGTAISSLWGTISFSSAGDINRERYMGALEIIFNCPSKFIIIMFGKVLGNTVLGIISMVISFVFIIFAFQVDFIIKAPWLFILVSLISIVSFVAIAMMLSGLLTISRNTRALMNIMDYPILILCGVVFPIEMLPAWTRILSYALSPTYVLKLLRMCVFGIEDFSVFYMHLGGLAALTLLYTLFFLKFYKVIDVRARENATLGVV